MFKFFASIISVGVFAANLYAVPEKQPTIAVLPFQVGGNISLVNIGDLQITSQIVENEFTNQIMQFLVKSRKFNVLNRTDIKRVLDENKLTDSEWAKPGQEKYVGQLLVSDYLVTGNINRLEFKIIQQDIKITGETAPRIAATLKTQFKVTEVRSGKVVAAGQVTQTLNSRQVREEVPADVRRDWTLSDYKDMLFNKAVEQVGDEILTGVYPVKIASINDKKVMLNRGDGAGIKVGQRYFVFNPGEQIADPDTGEVLGSNEQKVAEITITSVNPKFSNGAIVSSTAPITVGAICRLERVEKQEAAPAYPRATPGW